MAPSGLQSSDLGHVTDRSRAIIDVNVNPIRRIKEHRMSTFKAYLTSQEGKTSKTEFVDFAVDQLDAGEVLINVDY